jgi:hypothetical protein
MSIQSNFPNLKPSLLLDFANTKQLDNRITFIRSTPAVYYDGKTTAMAEQNLLTYSQNSTTNWTVTNNTSTLSATTAPDGTSTAISLVPTTATTDEHLIYQAFTGTDQPYTFSVYAKANGYNWVFLRPQIGGNLAWASFNLSAGTIGTVNSDVTATITSVGNGWYRCTATRTMQSIGCYFVVGVANADNHPSFAGNGTSGAYIWGAQLEQRTSVTAYTPTTTQPITNYIPVLLSAGGNQARFDCNPTTGESLGLLIEEQRTNLASYSSDYNASGWNLRSGMTVVGSSGIAPDGTLTASLASQAASFDGYVYKTQSVLSSNTTYTMSIWARAIFGSPQIQFNAFWTASSSTSTAVSISSSWTRYTFTFTTGTVGGQDWGFYVKNNGSALVWGFQLEAGSFATSYIATTSASATRTADVAVMTGTNFSSWFNYGQMTIYWEAAGYYNDGGFEVFDLDSGNNTGRIRTRFGSASQVDQIDSGGNLVVTLDGGTVTANAFSKLATGLTQSSQALSFNNGSVVTSSAPFTSLPMPTAARIGTNWVPSEFLNGTIKKIAFYPIKATNAQLQALTS